MNGNPMILLISKLPRNMNDVPFTKDDDDPAEEQKQATDMPGESVPHARVPHDTTRNAQWADPVLAVAGQTEKTHLAHMQPLNRPMNADDGV
jgi:hypothetical protein